MAEALKAVGYENPSWGAESYTNPITGQPNFVLISEHIETANMNAMNMSDKMSDKDFGIIWRRLGGRIWIQRQSVLGSR